MTPFRFFHLIRSFATGSILAASAFILRAADSSLDMDGPLLQLDDYLVETNPVTFDKKAPAVTQQVLGTDLKELNLATTVSALRNLPNIFIRERFIGDKNAPVGIRGTSNRQTGRTLVIADGMLLSNFLGTGFGNSPRWFLIAPEEIEKVAVIYGPFSSLYAGNSIGGTVLFTTKCPLNLLHPPRSSILPITFASMPPTMICTAPAPFSPPVIASANSVTTPSTTTSIT